MHKELLSDVTKGQLTEEDALSWMILLHTHEIHMHLGSLANGFNDESESTMKVLPAETQRSVAKIVAAVWPDRSDRVRCDYTYWYWLYNTQTPYEDLGDVPKDRLARVLKLRDALAQDPRVAAVVEETEF